MIISQLGDKRTYDDTRLATPSSSHGRVWKRWNQKQKYKYRYRSNRKVMVIATVFPLPVLQLSYFFCRDNAPKTNVMCRQHKMIKKKTVPNMWPDHPT